MNRTSSARYFTSENGNAGFKLPVSFSGLGLEHRLIYPYMDSIQQLPEVNEALQNLKSSKASDHLQRGMEIFEMIKKGGNEHIAVIALLAEYYQGRGDYDRAYDIIKTQLEPLVLHSSFRSSSDIDESAIIIELLLATAKIQWYKGDFAKAESYCDRVLEIEYVDDLPFHYASAMTALGLSRLVQCETLDDAFSVRDPFRMTMKFLEQRPQIGSLPLITAYLNLGISETIYSDVVSKAHDIEVPMDATLRTWKKGITILEHHFSSSSKSTSNSNQLVPALDARLQCNMAWGVLKIKDMKDSLKRASEFAGKALAAYDNNSSTEKENDDIMCRCLSTVAECYHKADQAVTSEGLYQSALDKHKTIMENGGTTFEALQLRDAYTGYANLCSQWEKREGDANKSKQHAQDIDENLLPMRWKGKSGILSTAWFWTPHAFK